MLPWNRRVCPVVLLLFLFLAGGVFAEDPAILKRGPLEIRGIDPLPRNAHKAYYGEYIYGDVLVEAFVTFTDIYRPENWPPSGCGNYETYLVPTGQDLPVFFYRNTGGWTLIARFSTPGRYCDFMTELIRKLIYFQGIAGEGRSFSFPAVLTFPD